MRVVCSTCGLSVPVGGPKGAALLILAHDTNLHGGLKVARVEGD